MKLTITAKMTMIGVTTFQAVELDLVRLEFRIIALKDGEKLDYYSTLIIFIYFIITNN